MTLSGATDSDRDGLAEAFRLVERQALGRGAAAADVCHHLAVILDELGTLRAAEALHRRAGLLVTELPTGGELVDRNRIAWACDLAANLARQRRWDEAEAVLLAAVVLARALLGPDDPQTELCVGHLAAAADRSWCPT